MYVLHHFPFQFFSFLYSAKIEAQENDLPPSIPIIISGFPTLKFKRAGTRDFIDYEGDRSFESLVAFVEQHAKNSLEIPAGEHLPQAPLEAGNATQHEDHGSDHTHHDEL